MPGGGNERAYSETRRYETGDQRDPKNQGGEKTGMKKWYQIFINES